MSVNFFTLYKTYLPNITNVKPRGFTECKCIFHTDNGPSAGIDFETGYYKCFKGDCVGTLSPAGFISKLAGISLSEAQLTVDEYLKTKGLLIEKSTEDRNKEFTAKWVYDASFEPVYRKSQECNIAENDLAISYANSKGFDVSVLQKNGIGFLKAEDTEETWNRDCIVIPYTVNGRIVGLKYRDTYGNKHARKGSYLAPSGLENLTPSVSTVLVTEGDSDRFWADWWLIPGLGSGDVSGTAVLGLPTATFIPQWLRELEDIDSIVFLPQSDGAGREVIEKASKLLDDRFSYVELKWKKGQFGKDYCEWGSYNENEVSELVKVIQTKIRAKSKVYYSGVELKGMEDNPDFLVNGMIRRGEICITGGKQKSKKTFISLELSRTILGNEPFCGIEGFTHVPNGVDERILFYEEEGTAEEFAERVKKVIGDIPNWEDRFVLGHRLGLRLDNKRWVDKIIEKIEKEKFTVLWIDPFQEVHSHDEDNATAMGNVWRNIKEIGAHNPKLTINIVHHFGKSGLISAKFDALRGSSRMGGAADFGIFCAENGKYIDMSMSGRTFQGESNKVYKLAWNMETCRLNNTDFKPSISSSPEEVLYQMVVDCKGELFLQDAMRIMGKSETTVNTYIDKHPLLAKTKPAKGLKVKIIVVEMT